jgi:hypothetical protein
LLALADRFEDAARAEHTAFAGDKPLGRAVIDVPKHKVR